MGPASVFGLLTPWSLKTFGPLFILKSVEWGWITTYTTDYDSYSLEHRVWHVIFADKNTYTHKKVNWSRYRPGVVQKVGREIALIFHDHGARRVWVVSSTPWPRFTSGKDPVPILQEAGWAPGPVWTSVKSRPHRDSIPDLPARSQSVYRLSYWAHTHILIYLYFIYIYSRTFY